MKKIAIISMSNVNFTDKIVQDGFIEGFANSLARMGNNVRCYIQIPVPLRAIEKDLIKFKPDLIISFNNVGITEKILKKTECPICLFGYDSVSFWKNINLVRKNYDKYYFIHHGEDTYSQSHEVFSDFPESHHFVFGYASDLRKKDIAQDINISFIGGLGNWNNSNIKYFTSAYYHNEPSVLNQMKDKIINDIESLEKNPLKIIKDEPIYWNKLKLSNYRQAVIMNGTVLKRFEILRNLSDLGLKVFSYPNFIEVLNFDLNLAKAFDFTPSLSLEDSKYNFNRSKISLNLPHAHAQNGFSCRVCAIMASNACLLSDYRRDLKLLMKPYYKDFPMFTSSAEAREIASKLLKEENYRKDIVAASQQMIEENCRFEAKIINLSDALGINLYNSKCQSDIKDSANNNSNTCFGNVSKHFDNYNITTKNIIGAKRTTSAKFIHEATKLLPYCIAKNLLR